MAFLMAFRFVKPFLIAFFLAAEIAPAKKERKVLILLVFFKNASIRF
jgi:hypothetical protein